MRIFFVKEAYDEAVMYEELLQGHKVAARECDTLAYALEEAKTFTEDKISVIILTTVKEQETEKQMSKEKYSESSIGIEALYVQTLGNFEVFYNGKPISFARAKSKELLAYLIDRRGAAVTTAEACAVLWEDKEYNFSLQRQFQTIVSDLVKSLKTHKCDGIIRRRRNCLAVEVTGLHCDFYKLMEGDAYFVNQYNGEYMSNYSWAEMTAGFLLQKYGQDVRKFSKE